MVKRTKKKPISTKKTKKRTLSKRNIIILVLILTFIPAVVGFVLAQKSTKQEIRKENLVDEELMRKMKKMLDEERKRISEKKLPFIEESIQKITEKKVEKLPPEPKAKNLELKKIAEIVQKEEETAAPSEVLDYEKSIKISKKVSKRPETKGTYTGKPKLAIIIDDVSFPHHVRAIKKIPYKVTPSFLPPTKRHPNSHKLVKEFKFYMVHLPLEALNHSAVEMDTLLISDSYGRIKNRIHEVKNLFPEAKYYNNHTGSKFTSDYKSMDNLLRVFRNENLNFIDSRTTADTKSAQIAEKYGMSLFERDIFLDNSYDPNAIKKQLQKAVKVAKKKGKAIAICHPHNSTLKVLASAKSMLKDVEVVYVHEL